LSTLAEVRLWGRTIGAVSTDDSQPYASFEYAPEFLTSGIQLSPFAMPLAESIYRFPELSLKSFHGLPGLLADSLPDRFGTAVIDAWLASQGRSADSFNPIERLCYIGRRGMGALEFHPTAGPRQSPSRSLQVESLVTLASEVLSERNRLRTSFDENERAEAMREILRVGTSAGGARAKAIIAWNPTTNEVRSGQTDEGGFEYWILKLDGVHGNQDKELDDPLGYGTIEYAYHLMATAAGIDMTPCRLLEEGGRRHFMTRRFDRVRRDDGRPDKLHMQSLGALAHYDYNQAGAHSYEQVLLILRTLEMEMATVEQFFRRIAFNVLARNQDDHVKNIAFLMDRRGRWSLSPAFDLTYSYNPNGAWTSSHQMTLNGKRDNFTLEDFRECAKTASMKRGRAESLLEEVDATVQRWPEFASTAAVDEISTHRITKALRSIEDLA
jgi:serine/threonine-protein kinase HipA